MVDRRMIDHVVVDVQIQKTIEQCSKGWDSTEEMGVAVACVWEYKNMRMRVYGPDDVKALQERLLKADRISGYNIFRFDFPVIWGFSREQWADNYIGTSESVERLQEISRVRVFLSCKTDDMLRRIWIALGLNPDVFTDRHKGWGLDAVAEETLGARKIGYGGDAPIWYQAGQIQKVVNYCADDVALERDLTDFVERYRYIVCKGRRLAIPEWSGAA